MGDWVLDGQMLDADVENNKKDRAISDPALDCIELFSLTFSFFLI